MNGDSTMADSSGRRVLVVDDNVDSAESLALLLQIEGHEVASAYDGGTALRTAESFDQNVVLLDLGLPDIDGFQVARALRAAEGGAARLLVALTGFGRDSDRAEAMAAGFDRHLTKPVDPEIVIRLLQDYRPAV